MADFRWDTKKQEKEPRDVTAYYQNPVDDYLKPQPEGMTYPGLSLAPKEALKDPNRVQPYDTNPLDWDVSDTATDAERNQRKMVRNYVQQLYEKQAQPNSIEDAQNEAKRVDKIANFGQGMEQMFKARSVSHGGPGVDTEFWKGMKGDAQRGVQNAELERKRKIEDYITKKKLGTEAVQEHEQLRQQDIKNKMFDPESDVSKAYQQAFKGAYGDQYSIDIDPNTGDDFNIIDSMSAQEILDASKMMEGRARLDLTQQLGLAKLGQGENVSPKTLAEIDKIKAQTDLYGAQKAKVENTPIKGGKGGADDFDTDKRFIASALKEKKALAEYQKATQDAISSFAEGGNYGFWEGYAPAIELGGTNVTGGKRSEYNAYKSKVASQIIDKVPGIRSDSDFRNIVEPMLPSPGDPKSVVAKKLEIFKKFLESRKPDTSTYDMLPEEDKKRLEGKGTPLALPLEESNVPEQKESTMLPPPNGHMEVIQDGIRYRWNGQQYVEKKGGR